MYSAEEMKERQKYLQSIQSLMENAYEMMMQKKAEQDKKEEEEDEEGKEYINLVINYIDEEGTHCRFDKQVERNCLDLYQCNDRICIDLRRDPD